MSRFTTPRLQLARPDLRVLSLWQPWASLVACGYKRLETRDWPATVGRDFPLLIHAAAHQSATEAQLIDSLNGHLTPRGLAPLPTDSAAYPRGKVVAFGMHRGCGRMGGAQTGLPGMTMVIFGNPQAPEFGQVIRMNFGIGIDPGLECILGDLSPGRYFHALDAVEAYLTPWPLRGRQKFFSLPEEYRADLLSPRVDAPTYRRRFCGGC